MNQRSYQRLIPVLLPLVLAACEDRRQEPEGALPSPEVPSSVPDPAAPGTPTPPSTPPSGQ
ncbi:MAG: hypothetical protein ACREXK_02990 [Gammaproteobacteria bacterium]